jgi:hypothetical protein
VGERRLEGDQPVQEVRLVVLEAEVEDAGLAGRSHVPGHLERDRRLAGALGAADEQELTGPQAGADRLVEGREAERYGLVLAELAADDLVVQVHEDVESGPGSHAPGVAVQPPRAGPRLGGRVRLCRHEFMILPEWLSRRIVAPRLAAPPAP